jgi:cholesterol transport system auxiliary component
MSQNTSSTHSLAQTSYSLKLSGTKAPYSLSSKSLLYLKDPQEIGAYLYSQWNDTPSAMIDRYIATALDETQLFSTLLPKSSTLQSDLLLESSLSSFYHRIHEDKTSDGYLDITYVLIDQKSKKMVAHKRFVITVLSPTLDAQGGVTALNKATQELSNQSIAWLTIIMKENKWTK